MPATDERALFEACCELPEPDRSDWLVANCADPTLRDRVLRLLRAHDSAQAGRGFPSGVAPIKPEQRLIGPYRVLECIGEGAIGEVFLAEQTAPVVRRVALKVIKLGMDSREVIARFEAERQTLAIMSHPCIAQIFDAGTTDEGRPYIAMEYVPGVPLTTYCESQKLGLRARLALFLDICDGVQHAHQKGIIHRDLKPSNLLVAERDGHPTPKIIDFGIAKATTPALQPSDAHTRIGTLVGTPEYMSPEQAQLSPLDVDTRSDVYSLGVVLYQILVGGLPYRLTGDTATPAQLVHELLATEIRAPSESLRRDQAHVARAAAQLGSTPRQLLLAVRGELDWVTLKALEKDRNRRYGSVSELAADVRRYLANEPVLAGPPSRVYRLKKLVARHQAWAAAISVVFLATAAFATVMGFQARELARERDIARFQAARAEASNEFMSLMLEQLGPSGQPMTMSELLDAGVGLLDKQYQGNPLFVARMLLQMSRRYRELDDAAREREVLARAESIALAEQDDELLAQILCVAVENQIAGNDLDGARARLEQARTTAGRVAHPPLELQVDCLRAEAHILRRGSGRQAALPLLEQARALLEEAGAIRGLPYSATLNDLGTLHFLAGDYRKTLEYDHLIVDAKERNGRGETLGMAVAVGNLAQTHYRLGEVLQAEELGRQGLDRMRTLKELQALPAGPKAAYAITLIRLDRSAEAEQLLAEAQAQARADDNQFWVAITAFQRGRALLALGRHEESKAQFRMAEVIWSPDPAGNVDRLADLERCRAELDLAQNLLSEARTRIAAVLGKLGYPDRRDSPILPAALRTAARIEMSAGSAVSAERYARAAVELAEAVARNPAQSADVGEAYLLLGHAQRAIGEDSASVESFDRASAALAEGLGAEHPQTVEARQGASWRPRRPLSG